MSRRFSILLLLALSAEIFVGTAARPPLLDDADTSHAMASYEMLKTGNWAVLHIDGIRYLEKPPLHYWLVAGSYALLGPTAYTRQLPLAGALLLGDSWWRGDRREGRGRSGRIWRRR